MAKLKISNDVMATMDYATILLKNIQLFNSSLINKQNYSIMVKKTCFILEKQINHLNYNLLQNRGRILSVKYCKKIKFKFLDHG